MDPQDDPEARIRDLERPLADAARTSELGTGYDPSPATPPPTKPWTYGNAFPPPPPPPPPMAPWPAYGDQFPAPPQRTPGSTGRILIVLGAVLAFLIAGGVAAYLMFSNSGTGTTVGGGGTITGESTTRARPTTQSPTALPPQIPSPTTTMPGEAVTVSGIEENRTIECNGNAVIVSGISNTLVITGHCSNLAVSGIENTITIDSADSIGVSGFENRVTYHSGTPEVADSGMENVVEQG